MNSFIKSFNFIPKKSIKNVADSLVVGIYKDKSLTESCKSMLQKANPSFSIDSIISSIEKRDKKFFSIDDQQSIGKSFTFQTLNNNSNIQSISFLNLGNKNSTNNDSNNINVDNTNNDKVEADSEESSNFEKQKSFLESSKILSNHSKIHRNDFENQILFKNSSN
jgi:hypothetical protein